MPQTCEQGPSAKDARCTRRLCLAWSLKARLPYPEAQLVCQVGRDEDLGMRG